MLKGWNRIAVVATVLLAAFLCKDILAGQATVATVGWVEERNPTNSLNKVTEQGDTCKPSKEEFIQKTQTLRMPFIANNGQMDEQVRFYAKTFGGTVFVTKEGEIVYSLPNNSSELGVQGFEYMSCVMPWWHGQAALVHAESEFAANGYVSFLRVDNAHCPPERVLTNTPLATYFPALQGSTGKIVGTRCPCPPPLAYLSRLQKGTDKQDMSMPPTAIQKPQSPTKGVALKEHLVGGKANEIQGAVQSVTTVSYFKGNDPSKWKSNISTHEVVDMGEVYDGIGLRLKAYSNNVEKLFTVTPEANPDAIKLALSGATALKVNEDGQLEAETELGPVKFTRPVAYQEIGGKRVGVGVDYCVQVSSLEGTESRGAGENSKPEIRNPKLKTRNSKSETRNPKLTYGFTVASYDKTQDLIIDPLLASTYLGGYSGDYGYSLTLDTSGNVYVMGDTYSTDFPTTSGAYDTSFNGGHDVFISKLDGNLSAVAADTTAPVTLATPAGGLYNAAQNVTLTSVDESAVTIYYTLDGTEPTTASPVYEGTINIASTTTLKFFGVDVVGNTEGVKTESYIIDTAAPSVVSTSPADGATNVAATTAITATFNEAMDGTTINTSTFTVSGGVTGTVSYNGITNTATFTPSPNLGYSTPYTVTVADGVTDTVGNPMASDYTWSFTTGSHPTQTFTTDITINAGDTTYDNMHIIVGNGSTAVTLTLNGAHTFASLTVKNNATVTHSDTSTSNVYSVDLIVTGETDIQSGGKIDVNTRGYLGGYSGGNNSEYGRTSGNVTTNGSSKQCGGSYSGLGGKGDGTGSIGATYGDLTNPTEPGAGGGTYNAVGGDGGGLIRLTVSGTLTNNGSIVANGGNGLSYNSGGGTGGGIYINCSTLSGSGTVTANGGNGAPNNATGGGGGGRIVILYTTKTFTGVVTAYGGLPNSNGGNGGAGTIYWKDASQSYGDLVINNNGNVPASFSTPLSGTTTTFNTVTVSNNGRLGYSGTSTVQVAGTMSLDNGWYTHTGGNTTAVDTLSLSNVSDMTATTIQAGTLNLSGGSVLKHPETTTSSVYSLDINVTGNMSINGTSTIDVSSRGYLGGNSGGNGSTGRTSGNVTTNGSSKQCGGSYGGLGGKGDGTGSIGATYGDLTNPTEPGAGGGTYNFVGGDGGGLIRLTVSGTLTNNGSIVANGGTGLSYNSGGGAGGGIYINCGALSGNGTVTANGGNGAPSNDTGGGGGGRIVILYTTKTFTGVVTAYGGLPNSSGGNGGAGTIYWKDASQSYGDLVINNNNRTPASSSTPLSGSTITFSTVTIANGGRLGYSGTSTVQVAGTMSLDNGWYTHTGGNTTAVDTLSLSNVSDMTTTTIQAGTLNLSGGSVLKHPETTTSSVYSLDINVTGNMSINGTSTIDVSSRGYLGGNSGGNGSTGRTSGNVTTNGSDGSCGGSYGGIGGQGYYGSIGATYGDLTNPTEPGAGGGTYNYVGGDGGGLIRLTVSGTLTNNGSIVANGGNGLSYNSGGGAGGGVYINCGALAGDGTIMANGGNGASSSGGGGGGRIAVFYTTRTFAGNITVAGGTGPSGNGQAGTIYPSSVTDTTAPVTSATPAGGLYNAAQNVTLTSVDESAVTIYYTLDGTEPTTASPVYEGTINIASTTTLKFFGVDAVGNTERVKTESYIIDTIAPTVSLDAVTSPTNVTSQTITGDVEADATVSVVTDNAASDGSATVSGTTWSYTITGLVEGVNGITVTAMDMAGNLATVSGSITLDTTPPSVSINSVTSPTNVTSQTITGTVEAGATVQVVTDSAASDGLAGVSGTSWSYTITGLVAGANNITVTATDAAGNTATANATITWVDAPTVISNSPTSGETGVVLDTHIKATFDRLMDGATINTSTFTVSGGVTGTVNYDGTTNVATFTPSTHLTSNTAYTVTITTDVKDSTGNSLLAGYTWNFTTTAAIRPGFDSNILERNDDGSTGLVPIGFTVNFYGVDFTELYVNNNGNITFDDVQSTYTPYDLTSTTRKIIAPFFADVDTWGDGSGVVTYGTGTVDGHNAFAVNWINVGYFDSMDDKLNSFQLVLIDRSDIGAGDFDFEFNYGKILWETGDASGGSGGLGGNSARAGYSNGTGDSGTFFELNGSAVNGAFLDSNMATGLINNNNNSPMLGRYIFNVRNGSGSNEDLTPPTVSSTSPEDGASGVAINTTITATFDELMLAETIGASTFTLSGVAGGVSYDDVNRIATFTPSENLNYATTYTATITTGVMDLAGNTMSADYSWQFTTKPAPDATAPTGLININNGAEYTTTTGVTLMLSATDAVGVTGYYASETTTAPLLGDPGWIAVTSTTTYSENVTFTLSSDDGEKTVYVWYKDAEGNVSDVAFDAIMLKRLPVVSTFQINNGADETSSRTVTLNNIATGSPTHYMACVSSGFAGASWQTYTEAPGFTLVNNYAPELRVTLAAEDGVKTVYFKVRNTSGESAVVSDDIMLKELPVVSTFHINNGAVETTSRTVALNNTVKGFPTHYMASESASFSDATWQTYAVVPGFMLNEGDGAKTVYFKVRNANGESAVVNDAITLRELPVISTFQINNGAAETNSRTVTLNNTATGSPTHYMASESAGFADAAWLTYAVAPDFTLSSGGGAKAVYYKVKNANGESAVVYDTITLKELPVVTAFLINNNAAETTSRTVTLNNTATGSPTHYMASESPKFKNAAWKTYMGAPRFTLSASKGIKTVYFKVKNANGESSVASDTITFKKTNGATIADAGIDQLARRGSVITLDGSRSFSSEGNVPLMYEWSFVSLPSGMGSLLSDSKSVNPTFTIKRQGRYEIQLVVKDALGAASDQDTVIVSTQDTTPVAHAGSDQSIHEVGTRVLLNGTQSYDPDGDFLAYQWAFISRPAESASFLEDARIANPAFVADVPGEYVIQLMVTDSQIHSSSDTVTVSFGNVRPVANAGKSKAVKVGDTVTLSGDRTDANGDAFSYRWILSSRPGESRSEVADASTRVTTFVPDRAGAYVAHLIVSDGELDSEPCAIQIHAFTLQTEAITALQEMAVGIAALDSSAFKNGDMQNLLLNKLNSVIANVEAGKYKDAANQIRNDILPKMGSIENREGECAAWIIDRSSQQAWHQEAQDAVKALEMAR